jgi:hypothetical protein
MQCWKTCIENIERTTASDVFVLRTLQLYLPLSPRVPANRSAAVAIHAYSLKKDKKK